MKYSIQFREKETINTDPQRRCYDGCHFSSIAQWTDWKEIYQSSNLENALDSVATFQRINRKSEYRIEKVKI